MKTILLLYLCIFLAVGLETFSFTASDATSFKPRIPFFSYNNTGTVTFTFVFPQATAGASPSLFDIEVLDDTLTQVFTKTGLAVDFSAPVVNSDWVAVAASSYDI